MQEMQAQSLGKEDILEKENGNPLQYFCLEHPMDRGAWSHSPWGHKELDLATKRPPPKKKVKILPP